MIMIIYFNNCIIIYNNNILMNYYEKYIKYKNKYAQLKKLQHSNIIQNGGDYKEGSKFIFINNDDVETQYRVIKVTGFGSDVMYTAIDNNNNQKYIYEKDIVHLSGNKIKKNKKTPEYKYGNGILVKFIYNNIYSTNNKEQEEEKMGQISRRSVIGNKNVYKINGPMNGIYTVDENKIIRKVSLKEFEEYTKKLKKIELGEDKNDLIIDHSMKYSNCIDENFIDTTIEAKIGNLYKIKYNGNKDCGIIFICDVIDNKGNLQKRRCKYFMDMLTGKSLLLGCDNYSALLHELAILKYIKKTAIENTQITDIIYDHILVIDEEYQMPLTSFNYMLNFFNEQIDYEERVLLEKYIKIYNVSNFKSDFTGIISPYIEHNINDYSDELFNSDNIVKSIFNVLYCIYVIHNILDIMHFNCDFENFCVDKNQNNTQKYKIGETYYTMTSNYCMKICNFDQSTKIQKYTDTDAILNDEYLLRKKFLCDDKGKCNKYNQKDIFIIISSMMLCAFDKKTNKINDKMYEIILLITNNNYGLISAIIKNNKNMSEFSANNTVFSSFCKYNLDTLLKTGEIEFKQKECSDVNIADLDIDNILQRYIKKYGNVLGLTKII
jgi:hypothetical protein